MSSAASSLQKTLSASARSARTCGSRRVVALVKTMTGLPVKALSSWMTSARFRAKVGSPLPESVMMSASCHALSRRSSMTFSVET
ncbi:hypothetical protein D3C72_2156030 [compost metagenome]